QEVADARLDGGGEVGVGQDHVGGLATELERDPLDRGRGDLAHALAGRGRTGEGDHVDVGVGRDRLAHHRAVPDHEVVDAARDPGLGEQLGEQVRGQGGDLARLVYDGAAGGERGGDLGHRLVQRVVPGGDGADNADRLVHDQGVADLVCLLLA